MTARAGFLAPGSIDRYNELIKRLTSAKGEPLDGIAPELLVDLTIEQAPALAYEWYFLMGTTRYSSGEQNTAAPGVGLFSAVELRNPVGSGVLATIEMIVLDTVAGVASSRFNLGIDQVALAGGVGFGIALDTREVTGKKSACQLRIAAALAVVAVTDGNAIDTQQSPSATEEEVGFIVAPGLVIAPGHAVQVSAQVAQQSTNCLFVWRERQLGASELVRA